ncbi:hypothetical protein DL98DRAFT_524674 [Cadophora sp. DSE1049]|nr:hypothetical protein DL98DRAFT_524674 [Cadophora sp. DSE1049]
MAPARSNSTPRKRLNRFSNAQEVRYAPIQLFPVMNLSRFDPESTKLNAFQECLKAARQASYELTLQAANIEHQLYTEWDLLSLGSEAARGRHIEIAMEHKEWYRELRDMHKQRIQQLEMEIQQESDYMNWRDWSPVELLIRWKSGNMDYSIFKEHEATYCVQDAFRLEAGLRPPKLKLIAMVSAQVAAGWYKAPTESIDWEERTAVPGYGDEDFSQDERLDTTLCAAEYNPQNEFTFRGKPKQTLRQYGPGLETLQPIPMRKPENCNWIESQQSTQESLYKQKVDNWNWDIRSSSETYIDVEEQHNGIEGYIHIDDHRSSSENLNYDLHNDELSIAGNHSQAGPSWADNYPSYEYSQAELDEIAAKAFAPKKLKKIVPMIAGRPFSKPIVAHEELKILALVFAREIAKLLFLDRGTKTNVKFPKDSSPPTGQGIAQPTS